MAIEPGRINKLWLWACSPGPKEHFEFQSDEESEVFDRLRKSATEIYAKGQSPYIPFDVDDF